VGRVRGADAVGGQHLDRAPEKFLPPVPEERLGLSVDGHDDAVAIDDDDGVRGGLEEAPESRFARLGFLQAVHQSRIPHRQSDDCFALGRFKTTH